MRVDPRTDALIVVDLQADFMPGGPLAVVEGDQVVAPIAALCGRFHTVVATQDFHPAGHVSFASAHPGRRPFEDLALAQGTTQVLWPDHCVAGTPGARLHAGLPDRAITLVLRKGTHPEVDSYSAFREDVGPDGVRRPTGLAGWLRERGISRVFVVGLARDYCVRATALDAAAEGFDAVVVDDLTRAVAPEEAGRVDRAFDEAGVLRTTAQALG